MKRAIALAIELLENETISDHNARQAALSLLQIELDHIKGNEDEENQNENKAEKGR